MTREEFAAIGAYLASAVGKTMPRDQAEVYFDLLQEFHPATVQEAARRAVAENEFPTIPPVGVLRGLALRLARPDQLGWGEAWGLVMKAVRRFGHDRERDALAALPAAAAHAASCMGWESLCNTNPGDCNTARSQFRDIYNPIAERIEREAALPAPLRKIAEVVGRPVGQIEGNGR